MKITHRFGEDRTMGQLIARLWSLLGSLTHSFQKVPLQKEEENQPKRRSQRTVGISRKRRKRKAKRKDKGTTEMLQESDTQATPQGQGRISRNRLENQSKSKQKTESSDQKQKGIQCQKTCAKQQQLLLKVPQRKTESEKRKPNKIRQCVTDKENNSKKKRKLLRDAPALSTMTTSASNENTSPHPSDLKAGGFKEKKNADILEPEATEFSYETLSDLAILKNTIKEEESWFEQSQRQFCQGEDGQGENIILNEKQIKSLEKEGRFQAFYEELETQTYKLDQLVKRNPRVYKRCQLKIISSHEATAIVLDKGSPFPEINISGRSKCGQAFNEDIVVVEILQQPQLSPGLQASWRNDEVAPEKKLAHGRVVGVYMSKRERYKEVNYPIFMCTLDEFETHLMRPVCKTVPKIHVMHDSIMSTCPEQKGYCVEIKTIQNGRITFKRFVKVDPDKREQYVFKVALMTWKRTEIYPLGVVLAAFIGGKDFSSGLEMLAFQHQVPTLFPRAVLGEIKELAENGDLPIISGRRDLTKERIFTIDPPDSKDLDDALSIQDKGDVVIVGVHIADVASTVPKGSEIDKEARRRATTFYPPRRSPHPMLPEPLSRGTCSLLPHQKRLAISLFFSFDKEGQLTGEPLVEKTTIKSCKQFSYSEVQTIINDFDEVSKAQLEKDIIQLHKIASKLRCNRIEKSNMSVPFKDPRLQDVNHCNEYQEARALVEEFMILTNKHIAKRLSETSKGGQSKLLILRTQTSPTQEQFNDWVENEGVIAHLVIKLQGRTISKTSKLSVDNVHEDHLRDSQLVIVQKSLWKKLCYCLQDDTFDEARKLIFMDSAHPLQCLALQDWMDMMEAAQYQCAHGLNEAEALHFDLQEDHYTHFTSPIRRYVDLHVQRLVHSDLDGTDPSCTVEEVVQLCQHLNSVAARQKAFSRGCLALMLAEHLRSSPMKFRAYVDTVSKDKMTLHVPSFHGVPSRRQEVQYSILGAMTQPEVTGDAATRREVKVVFKPVVYDVSFESQEERQRSRKYGELSSRSLVLNHDQLTFLLKLRDWSSLVKSLLKNIEGPFPEKSGNRTTIRTPGHISRKGVSHVTCENGDGTAIMNNRLYEVHISRGQIIEIQMSAKANKGILNPKTEMVKLAQNLTVCISHSQDPVATLSRTSVHCTRGKHFTKYTEYANAWLPLLEMESAYEAGSSALGVMVDNVKVKLQRTESSQSSNQHDFFGTFELSTAFCYERGIEFGGTMAYAIKYENDLQGTRSYPLDYLCLRCQTKYDPSTLSQVKQSPAHPVIDMDYTWTGHGLVLCVQRVKSDSTENLSRISTKGAIKKHQPEDDDKLHITFFLKRNSPAPPSELLTSGTNVTIEILFKGDAIRRAQEAVQNLSEEGCELARAMAYGKSFPELDAEHVKFGEKKSNHDLEGQPKEKLPRNNPQQQMAIHMALTNTLSLIQGPPGTGKTYTGIKLVDRFCKVNRETAESGGGKKTVLYMGPSNKSVDSVAKALKDLLGNRCPKLLRIYGSVIENKDYPVPGGNILGARRTNPDLKCDPGLQDESLHHIIRQEDKRYAKEILKLDSDFQNAGKNDSDKVTREMIESYRRLVLKASKEEMINYDVIFATCAVGGNQMCAEGLQNSVFQIIIDECAMIPEPYCLVPVVAHKAKQVVLIGDHMQLRPVVRCSAAANLGLDQSLFERLFQKYSERSTFLSWQYRMHPVICEFPSTEFYDGRLETRRSVAWTGQPLPFWPWYRGEPAPHLFVDVRGEEDMLTVTTDEGNEYSRSNEKEAEKVVSILKLFKAEYGVDVASIKILTQYNAQRNLIDEKLKKQCQDRNVFDRYDQHKINISTVVSSQGGEWDYVILSTVRSLPAHKIEQRPTRGWCIRHLGFITDKNQINVALTRARRGLIIVGNKELLMCDEFWGRLIRRYQEMVCIKGVKNFLPVTQKNVSSESEGSMPRD